MPRMFNRYAEQLNVAALPQELNVSSQRTLEHLESSAAEITIKNAKISESNIRADVEITNLAGHKLPTAYPSRRVWIHFTIRDRQGDIVFESGALSPDGSIRGNDSDIDGGRFEPHYEEIDESGKVQIYEAVMNDSKGNITTGLLMGVQYVKDNRLLPRGFDSATAPEDIAIYGQVREDSDFREAKDSIQYSAALRKSIGPYTLQAELLYQPIGYRWAQNLSQFEAKETRRFVSFYDSMADSSAAVLARATATVP